MALELRVLDKDNWDEAIKLKLLPEQEDFVASNAYSIAQSKYESYYLPTGIYDNNMLVGFLLYGKEPDGRWWLIRLMIDKQYQGRGFGRRAVHMLMTQLREANVNQLYTCYVPGNEASKALFTSLDFYETGNMVDQVEPEMVVDLTS